MLLKIEGVELFSQESELAFCVRSSMWGGEDALKRCEGFAVAFDGLRFDALFLDELHGWQEEVQQHAPLGGVEVIQQGDDCGVVKAVISSMCALSFFWYSRERVYWTGRLRCVKCLRRGQLMSSEPLSQSKPRTGRAASVQCW